MKFEMKLAFMSALLIFPAGNSKMDNCFLWLNYINFLNWTKVIEIYGVKNRSCENSVEVWNSWSYVMCVG